MSAIPKEHVDSVCRFGGGEATCAFLVLGDGFRCAKGTGVEPVIRRSLEAGFMAAKGENCTGWPPPEAQPEAPPDPTVRCRGCRREWVPTPFDDYYGDTTPTDRTSGLCFTCLVSGAAS